MDLDPIIVGWLAGLIEGEGCIHLKPARRRVRASVAITVGMTDEDTILKLAELSGVGNVTGPYIRSYRTNEQPIYRWGVYKRRDVEDLLRLIWPFMSKRRSAVIKDALDLLASLDRKVECFFCREEFIQDRSTQIYCSNTCSRNRWRKSSTGCVGVEVDIVVELFEI